MLEIHLRQLAFPSSACGPFTKNKERIQTLKETGESQYIYQTEASCLQHGIALGDLNIQLEKQFLIKYCMI